MNLSAEWTATLVGQLIILQVFSPGIGFLVAMVGGCLVSALIANKPKDLR